MKYAKKMMVVPFTTQTAVGSLAQQHNLNMSAALLKNLPKNEKTKAYLQALSKLRELSDTLDKDDKFKSAITQLAENIENNIKYDNQNVDIEEIEKEESKNEAAQKVVDYTLQNNNKKKSKKLSRELKHLDANNVMNYENAPLTRQGKRLLEKKAGASEELKKTNIDNSNANEDLNNTNLINLNDSIDELVEKIQMSSKKQKIMNQEELSKSFRQFDDKLNKLRVRFNKNFNKIAYIDEEDKSDEDKSEEDKVQEELNQNKSNRKFDASIIKPAKLVFDKDNSKLDISNWNMSLNETNRDQNIADNTQIDDFKISESKTKKKKKKKKKINKKDKEDIKEEEI